MRNGIIQWLRTALSELVQHGATTASEKVTSLHQSCPRIWHLSEVLNLFPPEHSIFSHVYGSVQLTGQHRACESVVLKS